MSGWAKFLLLGAEPDEDWNLTNGDFQSFVADCFGGTGVQTDTPEAPVCSDPAIAVRQSYAADTYETVSANDGEVLDERCDTDIKFFRVGYSDPFFYFEFELAGSWDQCADEPGNNNGVGRHYLVLVRKFVNS